MKNFKTILIPLIAAMVFISQSCYEGLNDRTYQGPRIVEFSHLTHENASWGVTGSYWRTTIREDTPDAELQVSMIGPQHTEPLEIGYYITEEVYRDHDKNKLVLEQPEHDNFDHWPTDAVEGVDYNILDNGIITIPANSSFGTINIELNIPEERRTLFLVLEERDVIPSENYKIFRLRIQP